MPAARSRPSARVADALVPLVGRVLGESPLIAVRCWDGSTLGPEGGTTVVLNSPDALRHLLYAPGELGLARAYVSGSLDLEGDMFDLLAVRDRLAGRDEYLRVGLDRRALLDAWRAARQLGLLGRPPARPPEEARLHGRRHSKARDAAAVAHHYDVGNDFYRLILGPGMTYSCAFWPDPEATLEDAQEAKYALVSAKLGLQPGMRLLDVGCGWGGMALHAARHHGVEAVGVTLSHEQQRLAEKRVAEAGLADRVQIRYQDYRDVDDGPYDAISSIGMFEHVGMSRLAAYFQRLHALLRPEGRLLNHAISGPSGKGAIDDRSFIGRYVFPDGELQEVGTVVSAMQENGLEVRDVESLREHYALTLRRWVANLESGWDEAIRLAGAARARVWRLYMAGSAVNFEHGRTSIHQVLGVRPSTDGASGMPLDRRALLPTSSA
jgi:cyclopropane-fatty-acyl-phospholipid synthase